MDKTEMAQMTPQTKERIETMLRQGSSVAEIEFETGIEPSIIIAAQIEMLSA